MPRPTPRFYPFEQLYALIGSGVRFTMEDLLVMMSACVDTEEDFVITHNNVSYGVPIAEIKTYFETHQRPERPMSVAEELISVKRRLAQAEKELATMKGISYQKQEIVVPEVSPPEPPPPVRSGEPPAPLKDIQADLASMLDKKKLKTLNRPATT